MGNYDLSFLNEQHSLSRSGRARETKVSTPSKKKKTKKKAQVEAHEPNNALENEIMDECVETVFCYDPSKDDRQLATSPRNEQELDSDSKLSKVEKTLQKEYENKKMEEFFAKTAAGRDLLKKRRMREEEKIKKTLTLENVEQNLPSEAGSEIGSFFFRTLTRDKASKIHDQNFPSVGYYNPKFSIISDNVSHFYDIARTMKKTKPREWKKSPFTSPNLAKLRDVQSVKSDRSNRSNQYDISDWLKSRRPKTEETGSSCFVSRTGRSKLSRGDDARDYWPNADPTRFDKPIQSVNYTKSLGRENLPQYNKAVIDPIYQPNWDLKFKRTTLGRHEIAKYCSRESQRRTTRQGIERQDDRFTLELAQEKFYDTNPEEFKFPRSPTAPKINSMGREDPRNNYLIHHYRKQRKTGLRTSQHDQSELSGFVPIEASSKIKRMATYTDFNKQIGRQFHVGFVNHDLVYEPEYDAVRPRSQGTIGMKEQLPRPDQTIRSGASENAPDYYNVRLNHSSKSQRSPGVNVSKCASRDRHTNSFLSRLKQGEVNDIVTPYNSSEQQLKLQQRSTGDPMIGKQIGREEINRLKNRQRAAPDKFYLGLHQNLDKFQRNEVPKGAHIAFDRITDRFEKIPGNVMKEEDSSRPYVVRGQRLEERSPPIGTYDAKYTVVDPEPKTTKFLVSKRKELTDP